MKTKKIVSVLCGMLLATSAVASQSKQNHLDTLSYNGLSKTKSVVQFDFSNPISLEKDVVINKQDNKMDLILNNTSSNLNLKNYNLDNWGNAKISTLKNNKLDVHINLNKDAKYRIMTDNDKLMLVLEQTGQVLSKNAVEAADKISPQDAIVTDIDFNREDEGVAQFKIHFKNNVKYNTEKKSHGYKIVIYGAKLPARLFRNVDVSEFDTPVKSFTSRVDNGNVVINIEYKKKKKVDNIFTKVGNNLVLLVNKKKEVSHKKKSYKGYLVNLDFQQIPLKDTIQSLANKMNLNVVLSEKISGSLTLKLHQVPYDEALNAILRAKNLGEEKMGDITYIAPLSEIQKKKKYDLEQQERIDNLTPLTAFSWRVKYADASKLVSVLKNFTTKRGKIFFDKRTNTLMAEDIPSHIKEIQNKIKSLDIPVRQVVVEARVVLVKRNNGEGFGINWGGKKVHTASGNTYTVAGGGSNDSLINLALSNPTSQLALGFMSNTAKLDLALSAMESEGKARIVSRPKVITANKKEAKIETGEEYPYTELNTNGINGTQFKKVTLTLDVTPQITPNNKIMMKLKIKQDSLAQLTSNGPAIDTSSLNTQVLANDGETIVLGGIYKTDTMKQKNKVPVLGDIPFLGKLFTSTNETKQNLELLIFITPKLFNNNIQ